MTKATNQQTWNHAAYLSFEQALEKWKQSNPGDQIAREAALMNALDSGKVKYRRAGSWTHDISGRNPFDLAYQGSPSSLRRDGLLSIDAKSFDRWRSAIDQDVSKGSAREDGLVSERERTTYENIIGSLLTLLISKNNEDVCDRLGGKKQPYRDQTHLIGTLLAEYEGLAGLSQTNLQVKLKECRDRFKSELLDSQLRK